MKISGLKVGDTVILESKSAHMLYDGSQLCNQEYKEIHEKEIAGKISHLSLQDNHYCYGEYAIVKWGNGFESECIHTSWLEKSLCQKNQ